MSYLAAIACTILLLTLLSNSCESGGDASVVGKWREQNGGNWEFTADGKALIKNTSGAAYTLADGEMMTIDFNDHQKLTVTYKYELSENKLILNPEGATGEGALPRDWDEPTVLVRAE